jgi:hypothetical protein
MKTLSAKNEVETSGVRIGLPVSKLYPSIASDPSIMPDLSHSIATEGMLFPIIVWECDVADWLLWSNPVPELLRPPLELMKNPTQKVMVVKCGNNRLEYAKIRRYDAIDCILTASREETSRLCTSLRKKDWS